MPSIGSVSVGSVAGRPPPTHYAPATSLCILVARHERRGVSGDRLWRTTGIGNDVSGGSCRACSGDAWEMRRDMGMARRLCTDNQKYRHLAIENGKLVRGTNVWYHSIDAYSTCEGVQM